MSDAPPQEIERRYLLDALPAAVRDTPAWVIAQGYLPGERLIERVRETRAPDGTVQHVRTVKLGTGVARVEVEEACDPTTFAVLWSLTDGRRLTKRRHRLVEGALCWEIDVFTDRALVLAEVELPTIDTPVPFPAWLAPHVVAEVTEDPRFTNAQLSRHRDVPPHATA